MSTKGSPISSLDTGLDKTRDFYETLGFNRFSRHHQGQEAAIRHSSSTPDAITHAPVMKRAAFRVPAHYDPASPRLGVAELFYSLAFESARMPGSRQSPLAPFEGRRGTDVVDHDGRSIYFKEPQRDPSWILRRSSPAPETERRS